jgi:arylesterase / paraoxonase
MFRILGWLLLIIVIAGAIIIFRILNAAGYFTEVKPHFAGKCETIEGIVGAEDIDADRELNYLFVSSQDRRPEQTSSGPAFKQGAIYIAQPDPNVKPVSLTSEINTPFHPHGISYRASDETPGTLAVVNHTPAGDEVLLFDVIVGGTTGIDMPPVQLKLRRTVRDPLMNSLNDVTLIGGDKFYATNDHGSETEFGRFLETWLLLPRANVIYFDGAKAEVAATGFNYANGIAANADYSEIYVAEATGRAMQTFRRNLTTGELAHTHTLTLPVGPDNLDVDGDGAIWIGAHPRLLDFLAHSEDPKKLSPSAALKVTPAGDDTKFEEIYANNGEQLSGSSVAVHVDNRLIIGPVFDPKFLNCTLN